MTGRTADRPWQVCAVCGYPLERIRDPGTDATIRWDHTRREDHLAVPVDADAIHVNQRCDFCNSDQVTHVVLCGDFEMPTVPGLPHQRSVGHWAACAECAKLVRRDRWGQLVTRVKQYGSSPTRVLPRRLLVETYDKVSRAMYGMETLEEWRGRSEGWHIPEANR